MQGKQRNRARSWRPDSTKTASGEPGAIQRIQRVEDLQYKEVFEFDLVSTTVDFDAPIALESESEFEVESLHLFVADSIQADIR